jgi:predicted flap endonuclease-1-like 5' DNA nuclease
MTRLKGIDGIGENNFRLLKQEGIHSVQALLNRGASIQGRHDLVKNTGISESQLMRWLNNADLFRIRGIGEEYVELLELAGIETVSELTQRHPVDLHRSLIGANDKKRLVKQLPSLNQIKNWIEQAKQLPPVIQH